jgi:hypothetical protein
VTNDTLNDLASIAAISQNKRSAFDAQIRALIRQAWALGFLRKSDEYSSVLSAFGSSIIALEQSILRLVKAARGVQSALPAFVLAGETVASVSVNEREYRDAYEKQLIEIGLPWPPEEISSSSLEVPPTVSALVLKNGTVLECISFLANLPQPTVLLSDKSKAPRRQKGRPESLQSGLRRLIVHGLLTAAHDAGGKLTFNRSRETNGTRALRVLGRFLPQRLIPNVLPLPTLELYYKKWKKRPR